MGLGRGNEYPEGMSAVIQGDHSPSVIHLPIRRSRSTRAYSAAISSACWWSNSSWKCSAAASLARIEGHTGRLHVGQLVTAGRALHHSGSLFGLLTRVVIVSALGVGERVRPVEAVVELRVQVVRLVGQERPERAPAGREA